MDCTIRFIVVLTGCLSILVGCVQNSEIKENEVLTTGQLSDVNKVALNPFRINVEFFPDQEKEVEFSGKNSALASKGKSGNMMYPGYDFGSFLAGVITHAVIQDNLSSSEKQQAQEIADKSVQYLNEAWKEVDGNFLLPEPKVLELSGHTYTAYYHHKQIEPDELGIKLIARPHYMIEQNGTSIELINQLSAVFQTGEEKTINTQVIRSPDMKGQSNSEYWISDGGKNFHNTIFNMFHESLELGLAALYSVEPVDESVTYKTLRFHKGGAKHVERGALISMDCDTLVFRTLRGAIKSVPVLERIDECPST